MITKSENKDFISKYVELLAKITDAPSEYQEAAMLFLISTVIGRNWVFKSIPDAAIFSKEHGSKGRLLNLWFIILGKSRVSRKTSGVLRHVQEILDVTVGSVNALTKSFTPEFLIKEMSSKTREKAGTKVTQCHWVKDEVAGFFKLVKKRESYMADIDDVLSSIYDGLTIDRGTIGREKEIVQNPYLTCFLAATDFLPTLFDELQIRLGFLNRFIFILGTKKGRKELRTEDLNETEKRSIKEIKDFLHELAKTGTEITMEMTADAKQIYDSFEKEMEDKIEAENLDIKEGYCGQLPNLVVRLSCLYRISRMSIEEVKNCSMTMKVEKQDVERAISYANEAWHWFETVIDMMKSGENKKLSKSEQAKPVILELLSDGELHHWPKIVKFVDEVAGIKQANVFVALKQLEKDNLIEKPKAGYYRIKPKTAATQDQGS